MTRLPRGRSILVVEDRDSLRRMMQRALAAEGHDVISAATRAAGIECLNAGTFDLVLTDLKLPDGTGLDIVAAVGDKLPGIPVVVMTAFGTVDHAVEAMKLGAVDFLEKPLELDELFELVRIHTDSVDEATKDHTIFEAPGAPPIVGAHPLHRAALRLLERVAPTDSTVLLTGESGTGKELFARAVHGLSVRSGGPFVAVNCAAIPETLIESELFGHERGAFTGATRRQAGRFERARGGTLFLDEIGELGTAVQGKLLRVLEEQTFERVGGSTSIKADARLVAATNRDLETMTHDGRFRSDLFFRLDVFPIALPSLGARSNDIPMLARHLISTICQRLGRPAPSLATEAGAWLTRQPWPGNVRQLANLLERALIMQSTTVLEARHLRSLLLVTGTADDEPTRLRAALRETDGDKRMAAERLGISYRTLQRKIRAHDLEGFPRYRDA